MYVGSSRELFHGDVDAGTVDRRNEVLSERYDESEDDPSLLVSVAEECFIAKGIEVLLGLPNERVGVEVCFRVWYLVLRWFTSL